MLVTGGDLIHIIGPRSKECDSNLGLPCVRGVEHTSEGGQRDLRVRYRDVKIVHDLIVNVGVASGTVVDWGVVSQQSSLDGP